jgi:vacuolar-type H+-ATPase subunit E/Vma4
MALVEEKLAHFSKFVLADANEKRESMLAEVEKERKKAKETREMECLSEAYSDIQKAVSKSSRENNERVLKVEMELKKALILKREAIIEEVFSEVEEKIKAFLKSPDYEAWLLARARQAAEEVGGGDVLVYVMPEDMKYVQALKKELGNVEIEAGEDNSFLGGVKIYNRDKKVFADYSMQERLEAEKRSFLQTSGLVIG